MKKKPSYFAFNTPLSPQKLLTQLPEALREYNAVTDNPWSNLRYEIPKGSHNRFRIGLERAGHSFGGYWYCATMEETEAGCRIAGNIVFNPDENDVGQGSEETLWDKMQVGLLRVLLLIPLILFYIGYGIYLLYRRIRNLPKDLTKEEKLVDFMTKHLACQLTERY